MALAFGLLAAVCIGSSDLFGRRMMQATTVLTAASTMHLVGALATLVFALVAVSPFEQGPFAWGTLSGLWMGAGLAFYYLGLQNSTATIVAPLVAAMVTLIPYSYAVLTGSPSSMLALAGAGVVVVGLMFVTGGAVSPDRLRAGLIYGGLSGLAYSAAVVAFIEAADAEGWWPAVGQRLSGAVLLLAAAAVRRDRLLVPRSQLGNGVMSGVITAGASLFYLAALAADTTMGVVATATFPAFSVIVGRIFFGDALQRTQLLGIALVVAGVAGVSSG